MATLRRPQDWTEDQTVWALDHFGSREVEVELLRSGEFGFIVQAEDEYFFFDDTQGEVHRLRGKHIADAIELGPPLRQMN